MIPRDIVEFDHRENLYKARALVFVIAAAGLNQLLNTIILFSLWDRLGPLSPLAPLFAVATLSLFSILYLFRRTGSFVLVANLYGFVGTLSTLCLIMVTGGFSASPLIPWWPLIVIFSFIMGGWRTACWWSCVALAFWLWGINIDEGRFVYIFSPQTISKSYVYSVVLAGFALLAVMWFFDFYQRQILGRLQVERDRALFSAAHDPLTGLVNRITFENRLQHVIERQQVLGGCDGVLMIDLDGFKQINDTHGHRVGDAVLSAIGERLLGSVRGSDLAARLGGDEFAVLLGDIRDPADLEAIVDKLHAALCLPIHLANGGRVVVGASIGVALIPGDGNDLETILHNADQAMYLAKASSCDYLFFRTMSSAMPCGLSEP